MITSLQSSPGDECTKPMHKFVNAKTFSLVIQICLIDEVA